MITPKWRLQISLNPAHQVKEQLATRTVVQHEEELVPGLEGHVEPHDEGVLHVAQHVSFSLGVLHLATPRERERDRERER